MKKNTKSSINPVTLIVVALLSPLILLIFLLGIGVIVLSVLSEIQHYRIRNEIFSYVQENLDTIELTNCNSYQEFFYTSTGLLDGGVEYGYYYAPDNDYALHGEAYRKGYRTYGIPDDDTDWYYTERICENWFYYEIHDG